MCQGCQLLRETSGFPLALDDKAAEKQDGCVYHYMQNIKACIVVLVIKLKKYYN